MGFEEKKNIKRWIDAGECTGCNACMLACSYHHTGRFCISESSIHIHRDYSNGQIEIELDSTCDKCAQEPSPLCVEFCYAHALDLDIFTIKADKINKK